MVSGAVAHPAATPEPHVVGPIDGAILVAHEALPAVGLHGLALAGYPPRRYAAALLRCLQAIPCKFCCLGRWDDGEETVTAENTEFKMTYLDLQAYAGVTKHMGGFEATKKSNWVAPPVRCLATWGTGYS
jgi:hypothetical protein